MKVFFDLASIYYYPQYYPVIHELSGRGHHCSLMIYLDDRNRDSVALFLEKNEFSVPVYQVDSESDALELYHEHQPDWIIFGNDNLSDLSLLPDATKTALLYHGIGVKSCYYDERLSHFDVRFSEGLFRQSQLEGLYPNGNFQAVGFAKLDPLISPQVFGFKPFSLQQQGLDEKKKTLLYAPTFYPSSIECMDADWPEKLSDYNIIIKPHFITLTNPKYKKQRNLLLKWSAEPNVFLVDASEQSLLPFMTVADLLISEASSTLFEFAALDKPVVWLDFLKLRWTYRGIFKYRFFKRMDQTILNYRNVAVHVDKPSQLAEAVRQQLEHPSEYRDARKKAVNELIGVLDGRVSLRVCDYLESNI